MEILRIEPTPSPNTMKVVLSYTRGSEERRVGKEC